MVDKIDPADVVRAAVTFTDLRKRIVDILGDHLGCEEFQITGKEQAAEALIFFMAETLAAEA